MMAMLAATTMKKMTIERTLKLDKNNKELEITTTIKKADAAPSGKKQKNAGQKNWMKNSKQKRKLYQLFKIV